MIVLINGTYGVGKSTVAQSIQDKIPNVEILESDFYYLQMIEKDYNLAFGGTTPQNNMNFLSRFKKVVFDLMEDDNFNKITIVVMAITRDECNKEILEPLAEKCPDFYHFILTANRDTIIERINKQEKRDKAWAISFLNSNIKYLEDNFEHVPRINTENKEISEIADEIIGIVFPQTGV